MNKAINKLRSLFTITAFVGIVAVICAITFISGYSFGFDQATDHARAEIESLLGNVSSTQYGQEEETEIPEQTTQPSTPLSRMQPTWGGPDLWESVNEERVSFGVNPLIQRDELCTIASIRLNELLDLGKLDGHEGFGNLPERRPDLQWIFDKYNNVSEFLVSGAQTADHAVELWKNTLGHKKLLTGGEYVWGCVYGQNSFGVAITAF